MKKIFFLLTFVLGCASAQAQVIQIYKNGTLEDSYYSVGDNDYKVVVKEGKYYPGDGKTHDTVDLGLSVKWATCNVGASSATETGSYFAWGETASKADYNSYNSEWSGYKYATAWDNMTKYNAADGKTVLDPEDDAATVNWGSRFRMPTQDEFKELVEKCTWTWDSINGGFSVKAANGNSIFLPAAGWWDWRGFDGKATTGNYWSSTVYRYEYYSTAFRLEFRKAFTSDGKDYAEYKYWQYVGYRDQGYPVRPVAEP